MSTTVRIQEETRDRLAEMAQKSGQPMTDVLDEAVKQLERKRFFDEMNRRYAELREDPEAWAEIEAERAEWDATLMDNLD